MIFLNMPPHIIFDGFAHVIGIHKSQSAAVSDGVTSGVRNGENGARNVFKMIIADQKARTFGEQ